LLEEIGLHKRVSSPLRIEDINSLVQYAVKNTTTNSFAHGFKINNLLKYIDDNYMRQLSISSLAKMIGSSPYHLLHTFKKNIGISLHQYILQTRIKKAKEVCLSQNNTVELALQCGFYDQSHFIRYFKIHVGITPEIFIHSITLI
jgi:AraC-like DNA-binding protein